MQRDGLNGEWSMNGDKLPIVNFRISWLLLRFVYLKLMRFLSTVDAFFSCDITTTMLMDALRKVLEIFRVNDG